MGFLFFIFILVVLLFSAVIHEVSHGVAAKFLGDDTAEKAGRLTLNPIPHLDLFGSIILPLILAIPVIFGGPAFIFAWAKPVPYNPNNLKNKKWGPTYIALAGPAANLILAAIFGLIFRYRFVPAGLLTPAFFSFLAIIVWINLLLAVFNLVPVPPLDGSKILLALLPRRWEWFGFWLERYGFIIILIFIFFGFGLLIPVIQGLFRLLAGQYFGF